MPRVCCKFSVIVVSVIIINVNVAIFAIVGIITVQVPNIPRMYGLPVGTIVALENGATFTSSRWRWRRRR
jgi:hypothetical protein